MLKWKWHVQLHHYNDTVLQLHVSHSSEAEPSLARPRRACYTYECSLRSEVSRCQQLSSVRMHFWCQSHQWRFCVGAGVQLHFQIFCTPIMQFGVQQKSVDDHSSIVAYYSSKQIAIAWDEIGSQVAILYSGWVRTIYIAVMGVGVAAAA